MRAHAVVATTAATGFGVLCAFGLGCMTTVEPGPSASIAPPAASIAPPAGCSTDPSLACPGGGDGWTCSAGDNPELEVSGLSCSVPRPDGPNDDFCCFSWTFGTSTCTPDDLITSVCRFPAYGYTCSAGDNPVTLDPSLNCSSPTPDGPNDDFCCT